MWGTLWNWSSTKILCSLNKEFPSQFQGLYRLLCWSCLTGSFQMCTFLQHLPIINLLKIQLGRTKEIASWWNYCWWWHIYILAKSCSKPYSHYVCPGPFKLVHSQVPDVTIYGCVDPFPHINLAWKHTWHHLRVLVRLVHFCSLFTF